MPMLNYTVVSDGDNFSTAVPGLGNITGESYEPFYLTPGCKLYDFIVYTIIVGALCILGVIGNLVAFAVFQIDTLKTSTTFLFQGLSLMDTFLLITCFPLYCLPPLVQYIGGEHTKYHIFHAYMLVYIFPLAMIFQTATIWVTVLVGINRYIAVCMPYQSARLCSVAKARQYLAVVVIFSIVYNIPRYLSGYICDTNGQPTACLTKKIGMSMKFNIIYNNILYLIFMLALPLLILTLLNIKLINTLKAINQRRSEMQTRQQQQDNNVTFVLIIVVLVFSLCQLPALINQIFWNTLPDQSRECEGFQFYYSKLSNMMVIVNSAVNFIIYLLFNKRFKSVLFKQCFLCRHLGEDSKDMSERQSGANGAAKTLLSHV